MTEKILRCVQDDKEFVILHAAKNLWQPLTGNHKIGLLWQKRLSISYNAKTDNYQRIIEVERKETTFMSATPEFKQQLRDSFEAMQVGQTFIFQRTFTEGDVALFCGVTGDYNPYHIDQIFAESTWFGRRIIPGLLTSSMITHIGGMIGFLATEMHFEYAEAVAIGDTITCTVTIQEKDEEKRLVSATASLVNQHGIEVLRARFNGFPSNIRLAR